MNFTGSILLAGLVKNQDKTYYINTEALENLVKSINESSKEIPITLEHGYTNLDSSFKDDKLIYNELDKEGNPILTRIGKIIKATFNTEGFTTSDNVTVPADNLPYAESEVDYSIEELKKIVSESPYLEDSLKDKDINELNFSYSINCSIIPYSEKEIDEKNLRNTKNGFDEAFMVKQIDIDDLTLTVIPKYEEQKFILKASNIKEKLDIKKIDESIEDNMSNDNKISNETILQWLKDKFSKNDKEEVKASEEKEDEKIEASEEKEEIKASDYASKDDIKELKASIEELKASMEKEEVKASEEKESQKEEDRISASGIKTIRAMQNKSLKTEEELKAEYKTLWQ